MWVKRTTHGHVTIEDERISNYGVRLDISFKYESGD